MKSTQNDLELPVTHKMNIAVYYKEAEIFERVLRSKPGMSIIDFEYTKTRMENNPDGFDFEITTTGNCLIFYWIGEAFAKRVMRYNLKHFALRIPFDDEEPELLEALEYCKEAFEFQGTENFPKGGLRASAYNKTIAVLYKFKQLPDEITK